VESPTPMASIRTGTEPQGLTGVHGSPGLWICASAAIIPDNRTWSVVDELLTDSADQTGLQDAGLPVLRERRRCKQHENNYQEFSHLVCSSFLAKPEKRTSLFTRTRKNE
jgi:hypothetical protein